MPRGTWAKRRFAVYGLLLACLIPVLVLQNRPAPDPEPPVCDSARVDRLCVLFVGNSLTYFNDLPGMFEALARSAGRPTETGMLAVGGATLADHRSRDVTARAIDRGAWDIVVLQEQSQLPSVDARYEYMYPALRSLVRDVRAARAEPLLFNPAAHTRGYPEYGLGSYAEMQAAVNRGYREIARELRVPVVPVGAAWSREKDRALWVPDGVHPSTQGTYLAACVFFATIFRESPVGLPFRADLSGQTARRLQARAARVVLSP